MVSATCIGFPEPLKFTDEGAKIHFDPIGRPPQAMLAVGVTVSAVANVSPLPGALLTVRLPKLATPPVIVCVRSIQYRV
jgi:hypothetical protein